MKKIYYEKVGQDYVPVTEYDSDFLDSFRQGSHLIMVEPGGVSRKYNIDPEFAPLIAAARFAKEAMHQAMLKTSELKPATQPITPAAQRAWKKLAKELGDDICTLNGASVHDIVEAGLWALETEANQLMKHVAVRAAYEQFITVAALTKEQHD